MGQERFLTGATLTFRRYEPPRPDWDHDHCEFCGAKFMAADHPDVLHEGYATADNRWVCPPCFADFRNQFGWTASDGPPQRGVRQ
jgi:ribosomal protein S27AE